MRTLAAKVRCVARRSCPYWAPQVGTSTEHSHAAFQGIAHFTENPLPCFRPTGSIGTQTLDIIAEHSDRFELVALAAGGNVQLLVQQVRQFQPALVAVRDAGVHSSSARSYQRCTRRIHWSTRA